MMEIGISIIIALVVLAVVLWVVDLFVPPDIHRIVRLVVLALFLIWLIRLVYPLLVTM